jgi:autotransporter-associated beta strand protein
MIASKLCRIRSARVALFGLSLGLGLAAGNVQAANYYFDVNDATAGSGVTNGGSYSWEDPVWTTVSGGTVATINYVDGNFPRFSAGTDATGSYTITANSNHSTVGMIVEDQASGATITLNGTGVISITGGAQQGVIGRGGDNLKILNKISGSTGGVNFQTSGGSGLASLFLYGDNDYALGTLISTGGGLNFNNNNSFGTGSISWAVTAPVLAAPDAAAPITIANSLFGRTTAAASNLTVTGAQPVTFTSAWNLVPSVTQTLTIGSGVFPSFVNTFSGNLVGTGSNILKAGPGVLVLSGAANNYTGTTSISAGTLRLGAANAIASTSSLIMSGGTLDPDAHNQNMGSSTMSLTANSTIDYITGGSEIDFANSSAVAWTGVLNLVNWDFITTKLRFGTDATGLTAAQLAEIRFNGSALAATIDENGYVIPEPSMALFFVTAPLLLSRRRRRSALHA